MPWTSLVMAAVVALAGASAPNPPGEAELAGLQAIWNQAPHNAFTDLVRFKGQWLCAFREGAGHVSHDGKLRVIASADGATWTSAALLTAPADLPDLRDPKITVTPDGRLMLTGAGALRTASPNRHQTYAWFSSDGKDWTAPVAIGEPDVWLWRVTWHKGAAWGVGYGAAGDEFTRLYRSTDGRRFEVVVKRLFDKGSPNEASLAFLDDDTCLCLLRRDGKPGTAMLGTARPPYTDWTWKDLGVQIGGPRLIRLPDGRFVAAGRRYDGAVRTSLMWLDPEKGALREFLKLPSGGDTSYPGLVVHEGLLWVSYYSSHEGKTSIYLAKVRLPAVAAVPGSRPAALLAGIARAAGEKPAQAGPPADPQGQKLAAEASRAMAADPSPAPARFKAPAAWELSAPLIAPVERPEDPYVSVKDPSIVFHEGLWHVFMTIRPKAARTPTEYVSFDKWDSADKAPRHVLALREKYFCAPQVFYFRPHKKWYLVYQVGEPKRRLQHQPAYSTTATLADPSSWTKSQLFLPDDDPPSRKEAGLDYWIICDDQKAYLFYTSLNGKMWRMWTWLKDFPNGFDHCEIALEADIFEASHTYRLKGLGQYLTIVEAGQSGRRYYKAYLADRLDGPWTPLADTEAKPFAGAANVRPAKGVTPWTDNISHGELIRDGTDETMTVDPANLRFVIQGVLQKDKPPQYGLIPWRIGMLTPAKEE